MGFRSDWQAAKDYADASKTAGNNNDPYQQVAKDYISAVQADAASKGKSVPRLSDFDKYMRSANTKTYDVSNKGEPQAAKSYGAQSAQYSGDAQTRKSSYLTDAIRQANRNNRNTSADIAQQQGQKNAAYLNQDNAKDYHTNTINELNQESEAAKAAMEMAQRRRELEREANTRGMAMTDYYNAPEKTPADYHAETVNNLNAESNNMMNPPTVPQPAPYADITPTVDFNNPANMSVLSIAPTPQNNQTANDPYAQRLNTDMQGGHSIEEIMQREYLENRGQITPYYQFLQQILEQQRLRDDSRYAFKDFQLR